MAAGLLGCFGDLKLISLALQSPKIKTKTKTSEAPEKRPPGRPKKDKPTAPSNEGERSEYAWWAVSRLQLMT